jgi:hypothetical protein
MKKKRRRSLIHPQSNINRLKRVFVRQTTTKKKAKDQESSDEEEEQSIEVKKAVKKKVMPG